METPCCGTRCTCHITGTHQQFVDGWRAQAIGDYDAANGEEISFEDGDIIMVTEQHPNGWWVGTNKKIPGSAIGMFPGSYVEIEGPAKVAVPVVCLVSSFFKYFMMSIPPLFSPFRCFVMR